MNCLKQVGQFFEYLKPADGPVIRGLEHNEVVYAKDQPEYNPLRVLRASDESGRVLSRWSLTDEQRRAVLEGADIYLELMTFHRPLQPIRLAVGKRLNAEYFCESYPQQDQEKDCCATTKKRSDW